MIVITGLLPIGAHRLERPGHERDMGMPRDSRLDCAPAGAGPAGGKSQMKLRTAICVGAIVALISATDGFATQRVATGLNEPVFLTAPPGDTTRVFIVEQHTGAIRILRLS